MNDNLKSILEFDSIAKAEEITGKSYKESEMTAKLGLLLHVTNSYRKDKILEAANDTNSWNQSPREFLAVVDDLGFEKVYGEQFTGQWGDDKLMIYWHEDGLLLKVETFNGKSINSAEVYFSADVPYNALSRCSHGGVDGLESTIVGNFIRVGNKDVREGLRHFITEVKESGRFLKPWPEMPFVWFLNYAETNKKDYDYHAINRAKLRTLPEHIKQAICFKDSQ